MVPSHLIRFVSNLSEKRTYKKRFCLLYLLLWHLIFDLFFWGNWRWYLKDFVLVVVYILNITQFNITQMVFKSSLLANTWKQKLSLVVDRDKWSVLSQGLSLYDSLNSDYCLSEFGCRQTLFVIQSKSVFCFDGSWKHKL